MTKDEAIIAMQNGIKLTHRSFTSDEWMQETNLGLYEFEDGCLCGPEEFWAHRIGKSWEENWQLKQSEEEE